MALKIKTDGRMVADITPENNEDFSLEELKKYTGSEWVQVIFLSDNRLMWIDEEGKLKNRSRNEIATKLLLEAGGLPNDYVAGDAFICNRGEA